MKITELSSLGIDQLAPNQGSAAAGAGEKARTEQPPQGVDVIHLSPQARLMQKASQAVAETPEVRPEKVLALQDAVQQGTYEVDTKKVANSVIAQSLTEK